MHRYRPAALKPCKTLWLCSVPCCLGLWSVMMLLFPTVWWRFKYRRELCCCSRSWRRGSRRREPRLRPRGCCSLLPGAEGSNLSFTVLQERKIHLESDQKIYFHRKEVILSGLDHMDVYICHLRRKLHIQPPCWGYKSTVNYTGQISFSSTPRPPTYFYLFIYLWWEKKMHTFCRIIKHCCINKVRRSNERGDSG